MYLLTSPLMFTARVEEGKGRLGESEVYPAPVSSLKGLCTLGLSVQRADGRHQHGDARGNRVTSYTSAVQAVLGHPVPKKKDRDKPLYNFLCVCYICDDGENSVVVRWKMQVAMR